MSLTDNELVTQFYDKARALAKEEEHLEVNTFTVADIDDNTTTIDFHVRGFYDFCIQFHSTVECAKKYLAFELRNLFSVEYDIKTIDDLVVSYVDNFRNSYKDRQTLYIRFK